MSITSYPYVGNRVKISLTFSGSNGDLEQQMLVDTGFKEEGIIAEEVAEKYKIAEAGFKTIGFGHARGHYFNIRISPIGPIDGIKFYTHSDTEQKLKSIHFDGLVGVEFLKLIRYEGDSDKFSIKML